jgi:hypothetical protein
MPVTRVEIEAACRRTILRRERPPTNTSPACCISPQDLEPPRDVRIYYLSGAQHGSGALPLSTRNPDGFLAMQPLNTLDYRPAMRASLTALDEWVRVGIEPRRAGCRGSIKRLL